MQLHNIPISIDPDNSCSFDAKVELLVVRYIMLLDTSHYMPSMYESIVWKWYGIICRMWINGVYIYINIYINKYDICLSMTYDISWWNILVCYGGSWWWNPASSHHSAGTCHCVRWVSCSAHVGSNAIKLRFGDEPYHLFMVTLGMVYII